LQTAFPIRKPHQNKKCSVWDEACEQAVKWRKRPPNWAVIL
jgi:hypothetical protein